MGKAWKVLRSVLNQNTNNRNPSTFKIDDETVSDPCFVEIGPKLAENLNTPVDPLSYYIVIVAQFFYLKFPKMKPCVPLTL